MNLFKTLENSIQNHLIRNAFCINKTFYTYQYLAETISKIRKSISDFIPHDEKIIGLVANDDIETYASILALWLNGKGYVPLNTDVPIDRNKNVIEQSNLKTVLDSSDDSIFKFLNILDTKKSTDAAMDLTPIDCDKLDLAYILFTSGTTGIPKGVPINRENLNGIIEALDDLNLNYSKNDRCLQMSELTFDVSVTSFLYPLLKGACVFTIPKGQIKFSYAYELMDEYKLTVAQLVPSLLSYLLPYFNEIMLPSVRLSFLTAEALPVELAFKWSKCVPNSIILNLYGPTENTVWSTCYTYSRENTNMSYNGMLSIGKALKGTNAIIVDEANIPLPTNKKGELCLSGVQLTLGYWNNPSKNQNAFFFIEKDNSKTRFYKTGDLCSMDNNEEILYMGRLDYQTKIQGFRVELSEIEFHVKTFLTSSNSIAVPITNHIGIAEIGLAIEGEEIEVAHLITYLKGKMPHYMIPNRIVFLNKFPLNINDKIDRNLILVKINESIKN